MEAKVVRATRYLSQPKARPSIKVTGPRKSKMDTVRATQLADIKGPTTLILIMKLGPYNANWIKMPGEPSGTKLLKR